MSSGLRSAAMNGPTTAPRGPAAISAAAARCAALSSFSEIGGIRSAAVARAPTDCRVLPRAESARSGRRPRDAPRFVFRDVMSFLWNEQDLARGAPGLELAMRVRGFGERQHAVDPRPQRAE